MAKIHLLDPHTINQIAAGEVIENPASVVKELIENSIDAGSREISIEIRGGGRQLIRITDDGCGMSAEDAALALERHATSKIRLAEDLSSIGTMGFRGEAIPSIASISKLMLLTCPVDESEGTVLMVEGGKLIESGSAPRSHGTTIEVKNLFFNVPVRKKFQRSPTYDSNEILKVVTLQSLAHPEIKFQLVNDGKTMLSASADQTLQERVADVLSRDFYRGTVPIEAESGAYSIRGVIGLPNFTRQNRTGQYLFINKRAIQSPIVSYAIRDGYGSALPSNRHPVWVLHVTMPGDLVDVNVHPQKREVRLREQSVLREALIAAIRRALSGGGGYEEPVSGGEEEYVTIKPAFSLKAAEMAVDLPWSMPAEPEPVAPPPSAPVFEDLTAKTPVKPQQQPLLEPQRNAPSHRVLATIQRYVILDHAEGKGVTVVDQRAAHARVVFEKLCKGKEAIAVQTLLVPYTVTLPPPDAEVLKEQIETIERMGISIRESGPNTFMVDAVPQVFGNSDLEQLIQNLVHSIREFQDTSQFAKEVEKQLAQIASRAWVSSGQKLSIGEAQVLVDKLMGCETPLQCPLGRSTLINIGSEELGEKFHVSKTR